MNQTTDQFTEQDRQSIAISKGPQMLFISSIKGRATRELIPIQRQRRDVRRTNRQSQP